MDCKQRNEFWEKLLSLIGKDKNADQIELNKTISILRYLYRYRPVNMKSLDALRTNKLYFSTANYYDDPFDTFIHVDLADLQKAMEQVRNGIIKEDQLLQFVKNTFASILGQEVQDPGINSARLFRSSYRLFAGPDRGNHHQGKHPDDS